MMVSKVATVNADNMPITAAESNWTATQKSDATKNAI